MDTGKIWSSSLSNRGPQAKAASSFRQLQENIPNRLPTMFRVEPDIFYTRADLTRMLSSAGIDVDFFIHRLKPRKVFRALYRGRDLLEAYEAASALGEEPSEIGLTRGNRKPRQRNDRAEEGSRPGDLLRERFLDREEPAESSD